MQASDWLAGIISGGSGAKGLLPVVRTCPGVTGADLIKRVHGGRGSGLAALHLKGILRARCLLALKTG